MNPRVFLISVLLVAILFGFLGWYGGYKAGMHQGLALQKGTLVGTLDALEKIRGGKIELGAQRIESMCFLSAVLLLEDKDYAANATVRTMVPELAACRSACRTNTAEWSPVEERLEVLLEQKR